MANEFTRRNILTRIFSSAPRSYFGALDPNVKINFVPLPLYLIGRLSRLPLSQNTFNRDLLVYDYLASLRVSQCDLVVGWAHMSLTTGKRAKELGARFVLERACPHVDFQQQLMREEAEKIGFGFRGDPRWFIERQRQEYELADFILVPSHYSAESFPNELRHKVLVAPIYGRLRTPPPLTQPRGLKRFTVGVVGGEPLRKGYLYLLQGWMKLGLPDAVLRIRTAYDFDEYPKLRELSEQCGNVEFVDHVVDMNDFYQACDLFILPSVDDGFGMALFEAMANGVPCIATTRCGAVELLRDQRDLYVIKPFDADEIAAAIQSLYQDANRRLQLGSTGRAAVEAMLDGASPIHYRRALDQLFH